MRTLRRSIRFLALVAPLAIGGCNRLADVPDDASERYAAVLCAAEAACGCGKYSSIEACESDVIAAFERQTAEVTKFDEACFEDVLAAIDDRGCVNRIDFDLSCNAIVGATKVGETCEADPRLSTIMPKGTCKGDAFCDTGSGVCTKVKGVLHPFVGELGTPCKPYYVGSCGFHDLYCASDGHCASRTADGDACSSAFECDMSSSFCSTETGICTPKIGLSESCNPDDWDPCVLSAGPGGVLDIWCNPETAICEHGDPYVCWKLSYPFPP